MVTINQKRVFKKVEDKLGGNGGIVSISKAMRGIYSKKWQENPQRLTGGKGWNELLEKHLPDSLLAKKHKELLNKRETNLIATKSETGEKVYEVLDQPETQAVSKALDMAYKLKDRYPKEDRPEGNRTLVINITGESAQRYGISPLAESNSIRPA